MSYELFNARQCLSADCASLNTIVRYAVRDPQPFVLSVRNRTVENVDSIGSVMRRLSPVFSGEVVELHQHITIALQTFDGFRILGLECFHKEIERL